MFGGGPAAPPKPQPQQQPVVEEDKAVQQASAEALRRRKLARGFRSTILSEMAGGKETFGTNLYGKAPDVRMA